MISGKVWKFGDDINTDLIMPGPVLYGTEEEQKKAVFSANRPGWIDIMAPGDIVIGGRNFGTGSSRPAARSLRNIGLGAAVAESVNGLLLRNSVNWGFPCFECPGVEALFEEGDMAEVSTDGWTISNKRTGKSLPMNPVPDTLLAMMMTDGLLPSLERRGLIGPKTQRPAGLGA